MTRAPAAYAALVSLTLLLGLGGPAHASEDANQPVRAVFGPAVTPETPLLPVGSRLPDTLNHGTAPLAPPAPSAVDADQPEHSPAAKAPAAPQAKAGPAIQSEPYVTLSTCRTLYGDARTVSTLDRYNWCAIRPSVIYSVNPAGQITGQTTFRLATAGRGDKGSRSMYFTTGADHFVNTGMVLDPNLITFEITYTTSGYSGTDGSNPACASTGNSPSTFAQWRSLATAVFSVSSAKEDGYSGDKVSRCGIAQFGRSDVNAGWLKLERTNGRADSALYLGSKGATVFLDIMPVFYGYSRSNPDHGAVAIHIWDAMNDAANTYPPKADKQVPGSIDSGKPLHRLMSVNWDPDASTRIQQNASVRIAACKAMNPSPPPDQQCDEYPFASSWEGAGLGNGNYSVRYLDGTQNYNAGNLLNSWYQAERILHRESYYLEIQR
ncbi:NucA/NucB deoxyribonuclease domain-containing protein [Streptomyces sp. NPDC001941]|uniref:NucA/NucB deoxyribonuclease domain-containing protein n=1 Tax=Streptomyces sp. NPDC001941 TaxID=3154659 RepID=UPI00331B2651